MKVVLDSRLELRPVAKVCEDGNLLVATAVEDVERYEALRARGAEVVCLPAADGRVDLSAVLGELGRRGINEVHVEGGARLNGALVAAGLVDELLLYLAPCLLGDVARGMFGLPALQSLENKSRLAIRDARMVGDDLRILARFVPSVQG